MTMSESVRSDDVPNAANPGTDTGESVEGSNAAVNTPALQSRLNAITAANPELLMAQEALITLLAPANPKFVALALDLPAGDLTQLLCNMHLCAIDCARNMHARMKESVEAIKGNCNLLVRNALGLQEPDRDSVYTLEHNPLLALNENERKEIYANIAQYVCAGHPNFGASNEGAGSNAPPGTFYPNSLLVPKNAFRLGEDFQCFDTGSIQDGEFPISLSPDIIEPVANLLHGDCNRSAERDFTWYRAVLVHTCLVELEQLPSLTEKENEIFDSALRRYLEGKNASSMVDTSWRDYLEKYTRMQKEFDRIVNTLLMTPQSAEEAKAAEPDEDGNSMIRLDELPLFEGIEGFMRYSHQLIQVVGEWSNVPQATAREAQGLDLTRLNPTKLIGCSPEGISDIVQAVMTATPAMQLQQCTTLLESHLLKLLNELPQKILSTDLKNGCREALPDMPFDAKLILALQISEALPRIAQLPPAPPTDSQRLGWLSKVKRKLSPEQER